MDNLVFEPFPDSKLLGAISALGGIKDAVIIIHGKSCCHSDNLLFTLMTGSQDDVRVLGSGIRSQDVLTGGYRKLSIAIKSAYEQFHPKIIAILTTSFTTMMADDVEGIIESLKYEIPCEIWCFQCAGHIGDLATGYSEVLDNIVSYMEYDNSHVKSEKTINILGIKYYDPCSVWDMEEIKRILFYQGIKINSFITASSFNKIKSAPQASINIVLSDDALSCAFRMKEKFNIPYLRTPYPFGIKGSINFLENINSFFNIDINQIFIQKEKNTIKERLQRIYRYLHGIYGIPVAVIGNQDKAVPLSDFLTNELGLEVKLLFIKDKDLKKTNIDVDEIIFSRDQFYLEKVLMAKSKDIAIVFGSTIEKKICKKLGIPLIKIFFPVLDEIFITNTPYAGFNGVITIIERIINSITGV